LKNCGNKKLPGAIVPGSKRAAACGRPWRLYFFLRFERPGAERFPDGINALQECETLSLASAATFLINFVLLAFSFGESFSHSGSFLGLIIIAPDEVFLRITELLV